jgi:hypothetical protein
MTAAIAIATRSALWVVADRRLKHPSPHLTASNAVKVVRIVTGDGEALLTYAGIGRVGVDRQISVWVYRTLRGISGLTLVQSLNYLAQRAKSRFARFLPYLEGGRHIFIAAASIGRLFGVIEIDLTKDPPQLFFHPPRRSTHLVVKIVGRGELYLSNEIARAKLKELSYYTKKYERGKVSARVVATKLAEIIVKLSERAREKKDDTISPESLVVMHRLKTGSKYKNLASEDVPVYWCFDAAGAYVSENIAVPCLVNGFPASEFSIHALNAVLKWGFKGPLNITDLFGPVPNVPDDRLP